MGRSGVARQQYSKKAEEIKANSLQSALETVEKLRGKLTSFAKDHQTEIQNDPAFRQQFLVRHWSLLCDYFFHYSHAMQKMCAPLGVDPLTSRRSFWAKTLGVGVGDYFFQLGKDFWCCCKLDALGLLSIILFFVLCGFWHPAVKIAEVCFATRQRNGGIIAVSEMHEILNRKKAVHRGDIPIAVDKLKSLGGGFRIVEIGATSMIVSVPTELDLDHMKVLALAESGAGCVTTDDIVNMLNWNQERANRVMNLLLSEGMAWEDRYHGVSFFWFPSVWKEQCQARLLS